MSYKSCDMEYKSANVHSGENPKKGQVWVKVGAGGLDLVMLKGFC